MKRIHGSKLLAFSVIIATVLMFSCKTETKKSNDSSSKSNRQKVTETEVEAPKDKEPKQGLSDLKSKELIYPWVDKLNIRDKASLKGEIIASIDSDAALEFTGVKSGVAETIVLRGVAYEDLWYKIITKDGAEGWVFGGAVRRQGESKGNNSMTDTKFDFPHFGDFDLSNWEKLGTRTEGEEVDYKVTSYQKGNQVLEITSSDMGEMHYGYNHTLKDADNKIIKERNFSFNGDIKMLEENVKDYSKNMEYTRKQSLKKHWYQLNDKPVMVNGNWEENIME